MFIFNKFFSYNTHCLVMYPSPVQRGAVGINESSEQNFVTKYIHALLGVCTTCIRKLVRNQAREEK